MLLEICLALITLVVIIIIHQFCKCNQIEKFDNTLINKMKKNDIRKKLISSTEEFITQDDISLLEESTLQMLSGIQNIKNKIKKKEINEEIDETLLTELNEHTNLDEEDEEYEDEDEDEEKDDDVDDDDDVVEGFMERSTHNCHSFK